MKIAFSKQLSNLPILSEQNDKLYQELYTKRLEVRSMSQTAMLEPQTIKISSKRQITIPAQAYKEMGFSEYAWVEQTDDGLLIRPIDIDDEDVSIYVLRKLVEAGYEGEDLVERYKDAFPAITKFHRELSASIEQGKSDEATRFEDTNKKLRAKYGL